MATYQYFRLKRSISVFRQSCPRLSFVPVDHRLILKRTMASASNFDFDIVEKVYKLVVKEKLLSGQHERDNKVIDFVQPEELSQRFGGLEITQKANSDIQAIIENVVKYSVKTCHPRFFNQLYHGSDPAGLAGQVSLQLIFGPFKNNILKFYSG